jgi:hypothetical protein
MLLPSNNEPPTDIIQDQEPEEDSTGMDRRDSQSADLNKLVIVVIKVHINNLCTTFLLTGISILVYM